MTLVALPRQAKATAGASGRVRVDMPVAAS
jgi:hypothetical protein